MTLIILSMGLPVQAQVKQVEELQYLPLPELVIPEPERVVLENGMVVLLMEDHELPLVSLSAFIRTGSRLEPQDKIGLASLTGTVLRTGGTTKQSGDELDEFLEGKAAMIETAIGENRWNGFDELFDRRFSCGIRGLWRYFADSCLCP